MKRKLTMKNLFLSLFIDTIEFLIDSVTGEVQVFHGQIILPEPGYGDSRNLAYTEIYYTHGERL